MHMAASLPALTVSAVGVWAVLTNLVLGARAARCDGASALPRFVVAADALVIALLVFLGVVAPVVGYGMLCVVLVAGLLFDLMREERARRRRVASLAPRPAAEAVPAVWVAIAVASVLMLVPYAMLKEQRAGAVMVGICALVMAGIAWRIASAPVQLRGDDVQSERLRDRASRSLRAGMSAVLAIGSIFVFLSFVNASLPTVPPLQRMLPLVSFVTWAALWAWVMLYWRRLNRLTCAAS